MSLISEVTLPCFHCILESTARWRDPRMVQCVRIAGLRMLLETEGRPVSMTVPIERIIREAEAVYEQLVAHHPWSLMSST